MIEIKDALAAPGDTTGMSALPPFRERTAAQLREQADAFRTTADLALPAERQRLLRLAARYDELSRLKQAEEPSQ